MKWPGLGLYRHAIGRKKKKTLTKGVISMKRKKKIKIKTVGSGKLLELLQTIAILQDMVRFSLIISKSV